ncbi:MAG: hypothetical protein ACK5XA_08435 [Tagaea sp.]
MPTTTRPTTAGRIMVESDGCDRFGNLWQGAIVCRVSMPAAIAARYADAYGFDLRALDLDRRSADPDALPAGVRVHEWRCVR